MSARSTLQRRGEERKHRAGVLRIETKDQLGHPKVVTADLEDVSSSGIGVTLRSFLKPGCSVVVRGNLGERSTPLQAEVCWCVEREQGFRAGLTFSSGPNQKESDEENTNVSSDEVDYYELMQLSPNADGETIARVYRLLAQRYHPDNVSSGNGELFVQLTEAYKVLSDASARARYDAVHQQRRRLRWRIFDGARVGEGKDEEQRKRRGILSLLYAKMLYDSQKAYMKIFEIEDLLGCPREHLEATLWYLRGKGFVQRTDDGRYVITIEGFDEVERNNWIATNSAVPLIEARPEKE